MDPSTGDTILHASVRKGLAFIPLIVHLCEHYKADPNKPNGKGDTALTIAVGEGHLEVATVSFD